MLRKINLIEEKNHGQVWSGQNQMKNCHLCTKNNNFRTNMHATLNVIFLSNNCPGSNFSCVICIAPFFFRILGSNFSLPSTLSLEKDVATKVFCKYKLMPSLMP